MSTSRATALGTWAAARMSSLIKMPSCPSTVSERGLQEESFLTSVFSQISQRAPPGTADQLVYPLLQRCASSALHALWCKVYLQDRVVFQVPTRAFTTSFSLTSAAQAQAPSWSTGSRK